MFCCRAREPGGWSWKNHQGFSTCISSDVLAALSLVAVFGKGASVFRLKLLGLLLILQRGDSSGEGRGGGGRALAGGTGDGTGLGNGLPFPATDFSDPRDLGDVFGHGAPSSPPLACRVLQGRNSDPGTCWNEQP